MVRSMYSGVSGLRSHQTRMDTIGNNIANVNTYGFKSGRTSFRDIYYQTRTSASEATASRGGVNPSAVGYGSKVGSIDLMMTQSTFSMTDYTMDCAIDGEGFFQVQDEAGNIYYTRAGMLNFDAAGNLVDMQGNFVLGVNGNPTGRAAASERIQVVLPPVQPTAASVVQTVNGLEFTISASNPTPDGNLNFNFTTDASLADDEVKASISTTGIIITMNPNNTYSSLAQLSDAVNKAITEANGGEQHVGGIYTIEYTGDPTKDPFNATNMPAVGYYKASDICSVDYNVQKGSVSYSAIFSDGGTPTPLTFSMNPTGTVGTAFGEAFTNADGTATLPADMSVTYDAATETYTFSVVIDSQTYEAKVSSANNAAGKVQFKNTTSGNESDYFEVARPKFGDIDDVLNKPGGAVTTALTNPQTVQASMPSVALGFSSTAFALRGGTMGGTQTIADMTGIEIGTDGIIRGWDSVGELVIIGRIDLATFANPAGLNQAGSSNYTVSANSGPAQLTIPGSGGAGQLVGGTLELSNVDLSREFSDMITTQRGYQANSRIITVSDTMLEELINLKR